MNPPDLVQIPGFQPRRERPPLYVASIELLFPPPPGEAVKHRKFRYNVARRWRRQCEEAAGILLMELEKETRFPAPVVMLDKAPYTEPQAYYITAHFTEVDKALPIALLLGQTMRRWPVLLNWEIGIQGDTQRSKRNTPWPGPLSDRERARRRRLEQIRWHETKGRDSDWRNVGKPAPPSRRSW